MEAQFTMNSATVVLPLVAGGIVFICTISYARQQLGTSIYVFYSRTLSYTRAWYPLIPWLPDERVRE